MKTSRVNMRLNPIDILFLLRPPMLIPVWAFFLAGYWRTVIIHPVAIPGRIRGALNPGGYFWLSFLSFSLVMGAVYIINQVVDSESDRVNQKLFLIPLGIVPVRLAFAIVAVLTLASFCIGWVFGVHYMVLLGISFIIGILYSVRPIRLKGRPVLDILANAVGYGVLAFGIGWITDASFTANLFLRSVPYFFAAATIFTSSTILDMEGDRKDGAITTAVRFGTILALVISLAALLGALVSAVILTDYVIAITSIIGVPLIGVALAKRDRQFITLYMRGTSYVFILLIAVLFPWFFGVLLFVFFSARIYYRYRFGMVYPRLLEKEA
jgi:4-hydroxybenzoate polyprenyltransferase